MGIIHKSFLVSPSVHTEVIQVIPVKLIRLCDIQIFYHRLIIHFIIGCQEYGLDFWMLRKLFCEIGKCILVDQDCKLIFRQDHHVRDLLPGQFRAFSFCTSFQPQRRQHFRKAHTERNRRRIQEAKFEECCICFETICHMHRRLTAKIISL